MAAPAYSGVQVRQISTLWSDPHAPYIGYANRALDNNTSGFYQSATPPNAPCSHTNRPAPLWMAWWPWMVVDLGATVPANSQLVSVRLWNRQDCCSGEEQAGAVKCT
jgi:hypothetical protein